MQQHQPGALLNLLQNFELSPWREGREIAAMAKDDRIVRRGTEQAQQLNHLFGLFDPGDRPGVHVALSQLITDPLTLEQHGIEGESESLMQLGHLA